MRVAQFLSGNVQESRKDGTEYITPLYFIPTKRTRVRLEERGKTMTTLADAMKMYTSYEVDDLVMNGKSLSRITRRDVAVSAAAVAYAIVRNDSYYDCEAEEICEAVFSIVNGYSRKKAVFGMCFEFEVSWRPFKNSLNGGDWFKAYGQRTSIDEHQVELLIEDAEEMLPALSAIGAKSSYVEAFEAGVPVSDIIA